MSKKAVLGVLAAAIAVAYGGSTWWAGAQIKSSYDVALGELPKQTALVRVIERSYERNFFGAVSTVTLELGCPAEAEAATAPAASAPAAAPAAATTDVAEAATEGDDEEPTEDDNDAKATPPKPVRITFRDTIHHGPFAGGTLAAAVIDSELVLDAKAQAEAEKLFGKAKPLTAHTKVGFGGGFTTDLTVAPAKLAEEGKGEFAWQGAQARLDMNAARTHVRYDMTMPGLDVSTASKGVQLKMGKFTAKADMDGSAGWMLATGKTEGRLDSFELNAPKGLVPGAEGATPAKAIKVLLQSIDLTGEATIKDGLYASEGAFKGKGKVNETTIDKFEIASSARRIQAAGYKKLADAWLQSTAGAGCGQRSKAQKDAMQALVEQLAPDLKAMARHSPEAGIDRMLVEVGGQSAEISYSVALAGVTDEDMQLPGNALVLKRGVLKANARVPVKWIEKLAETGAGSGQTPPPEMVAGLIEQAEENGYVKRAGDDVVSQVEFSEGQLKLIGKPVGSPLGK
ncbi:YdgA family protein [Variovorax sp. Root473]|uniref:YdgA family protein n=1 Tax=Variovorax sp. Root473 TaxID=1736541 RepID=UPI000A5775B4|nr:YdgA family protein [Variovorax sp. Root473]